MVTTFLDEATPLLPHQQPATAPLAVCLTLSVAPRGAPPRGVAPPAVCAALRPLRAAVRRQLARAGAGDVSDVAGLAALLRRAEVILDCWLADDWGDVSDATVAGCVG